MDSTHWNDTQLFLICDAMSALVEPGGRCLKKQKQFQLSSSLFPAVATSGCRSHDLCDAKSVSTAVLQNTSISMLPKKPPQLVSKTF